MWSWLWLGGNVGCEKVTWSGFGRCGVEKCFVTGDVATVAWVAPARQEGMGGSVLSMFVQWICFR